MVLKTSALLSKAVKFAPKQQHQRRFSDSLIVESVEAAEATIRRWASPHLYDSSSTCSLSSLFAPQNRREGRRFLQVIGRLQYAIQSTILVNPDSIKLAQAQDLMRIAMKHLEKEFYRILKSNRQFLDPESVSGWSSDSNTSSRSSGTLSDSESDAEVDYESSSELANESGGFGDTDAIVDLKMIANCMISSGYEKDCVNIYKKFRKKIIAEALSQLGFEKLTSIQMQKQEWEILEKMIKTWVRVVTVAITTLFNGERILSDHIFSSSSIAESSFAELTRQSALTLFIFPINIAKFKKSAEKIFSTLDVYQTIFHLIPKIEQIFSYESTASVRSQAIESLEKLSLSINAMMTEFQSSITKESSKTAIPGGGIHPLTRYVMNFIVFLADYDDSLVNILKESSFPLPEDYFTSNRNNNEKNLSGTIDRSPMATRLAWLIFVLLCKIDAKSRFYNNSALSYLFLANNIHYVLTKVRTSNLKIVLGDDWVTNHEVKVSRYLEIYEKKAWRNVISSLPGDSTPEKQALESLRRFNEAFEEAYKIHQSWVVPDPKLREEIKASITKKIIPGYTGFYKKYPVGSDEIVRFTPEDLNNHITDLYIGLKGSVPVTIQSNTKFKFRPIRSSSKSP